MEYSSKKNSEKTFASFLNEAASIPSPKPCAVVSAAHSEGTLSALRDVHKKTGIDFFLTGNKKLILETASKMDFDISADKILDCENDVECAEKAVSFIRNNKNCFLVKGKIETSTLMKAVVDKEKGLRAGKLLSHTALFELPAYHKLLALTDGGMIPYPDFEQKKEIIKNAGFVFESLGYKKPKIAVLAAAEKINEHMPETKDAALLKECAERGELGAITLEGPVSLDLALSKKSAALKGYESPLAGDADILVVPNITAGNILAKSFVYMGGAKMAGAVIGAKVPIELTSRGASAEEKFFSILLTALLC